MSVEYIFSIAGVFTVAQMVFKALLLEMEFVGLSDDAVKKKHTKKKGRALDPSFPSKTHTLSRSKLHISHS